VTAANSAYRVAALEGSWIDPDSSMIADLTGPILLIDDLSDTGWTLTMAARHLRRAGVGEVLPFALASTN
jgi:ATP-dependent DNA helicase RecQ